MFSQKLILPLCKLCLSSRRIAPCCCRRAEPWPRATAVPFGSAFPVRPPRSAPAAEAARKFLEKEQLDPAQLHLQPQPGHTPAPLHSAALQDNIHIFLLESALAAAFATKSERGHTGNAEFPRFGQTKSLLSFTRVSFKKVLPVASRPQAPLFQSAAQFGNSQVRNCTDTSSTRTSHISWDFPHVPALPGKRVA